MARFKRNEATDDDNDRKVLNRARKFLAERGIEPTAIIHREDAAHLMVKFAQCEQEFQREMEIACEVMEKNREALRKLAGH